MTQQHVRLMVSLLHLVFQLSLLAHVAVQVFLGLASWGDLLLQLWRTFYAACQLWDAGLKKQRGSPSHDREAPPIR